MGRTLPLLWGHEQFRRPRQRLLWPGTQIDAMLRISKKAAWLRSSIPGLGEISILAGSLSSPLITRGDVLAHLMTTHEAFHPGTTFDLVAATGFCAAILNLAAGFEFGLLRFCLRPPISHRGAIGGLAKAKAGKTIGVQNFVRSLRQAQWAKRLVVPCSSMAAAVTPNSGPAESVAATSGVSRSTRPTNHSSTVSQGSR